MLRFLFILIFILMAAALNSSVLPWIAVFDVVPNLILIAVVSWGILRGGREAAIFGFFAGLTQDIFSSFLYLHAFSMCAAGFLAGAFGETMDPSGRGLFLSVISAMTLIVFSVEGVILYFFLGKPLPHLSHMASTAAISVAYNGLLGLISFPIIKAFSDRIGSGAREESLSF